MNQPTTRSALRRRLGKPTQDRIVPGLSLLVALGGLAGILMIFFWVPTDAAQGLPQRIFYVHVPTALIAYGAFGMVLVGSVAFLKTGKRGWDGFAHAAAEVGVLFTGCNIVTGMLWGKPIWGTYWTWDPRLTTTFVMLLIYVGYLAFRVMATDRHRAARLAAVIGIVGFVDVPLVHYSVQWWQGLHPAMRIINTSGPQSLPTSMLVTMFWMTLVLAGLFVVMMILRVRLESTQEAINEAEAALAEANANAAAAQAGPAGPASERSEAVPAARSSSLTIQPGGAR